MGKREMSKQGSNRKLLWVEGSILGEGRGRGKSDFSVQEGSGSCSEPGPSLSSLQPAEPQRELAELCLDNNVS